MAGRAPASYRISLGKELKALRERAGLTREEVVASVAGFDNGALSRIEAGKRVPRAADLDRLLACYGGDDRESDNIRELAKHARRRTRFGKVPDWVRNYLALEADAVDLALYFGEIVPGLCQTEDYARALVSTSVAVAPADVDQLVETRMARRALFTRENPPTVHVVLGQAAISYTVGGPKVMAAQIDRLLELAGLPHVTIQIAPFSAGAHAALGSSFIVLTADTDGERTEWCYTERLDGADFTPNPRSIRVHRLTFTSLMVNALGERETLSLLKKTRKSHLESVP